MTDALRARDLMRSEFTQVGTSCTLGDAVVALREAQLIEDRPDALMVVDPDGHYAGMLTAKLVIRILVGAGESIDDAELLPAARERLAHLIADTVIPEIAVVEPTHGLLTMIRRGLPTRMDFVPVVEDGRPCGFVPITTIFEAAASIALTPEHEGIQFDR